MVTEGIGCKLTSQVTIPADIRITECTSDMEMDMSSINGDSEPVKLTFGPCTNNSIANICYFGCFSTLTL